MRLANYILPAILLLALSCSTDAGYENVGPPKVPDAPQKDNPETPVDIYSIDPEYYTSSDFSADGKVELLQKAGSGAGIDIVIMGDAFTDRLISNGEYDKLMKRAMEAFFSEEPYKSFRDCFNVYEIYAVSKSEMLYNPSVDKEAFNDPEYSTALGAFLTASSVTGDYNKVKEYLAKLFVGDQQRADDATVIVLCNKHSSYLGSCLMLPCEFKGNMGKTWSNGLSISYLTLGVINISLGYEDFSDLVLHEAAGHGFGKFADEYVLDAQASKTMEISQKNTYLQYQQKGWYCNVGFSADSTAVPWKHFLEDERYDGMGLGVFEGCATYGKGIYRPTKNGIMNSNRGGFSPIERETIYKRINKTAYGDGFVYDYETFVEWDSINSGSAATSSLTD